MVKYTRERLQKSPRLVERDEEDLQVVPGQVVVASGDEVEEVGGEICACPVDDQRDKQEHEGVDEERLASGHQKEGKVDVVGPVDTLQDGAFVGRVLRGNVFHGE